jgi:hypothetical protein
MNAERPAHGQTLRAQNGVPLPQAGSQARAASGWQTCVNKVIKP